MLNVYQVVYSGSSNLISYRTLVSLLSLCFKIKQSLKKLLAAGKSLLFLLELWLMYGN